MSGNYEQVSTKNNSSYIQKMIKNVRNTEKYGNYPKTGNNININNSQSNTENNFVVPLNKNFIKTINLNHKVKKHKTILDITKFNRNIDLGKINMPINYDNYTESDISKLLHFLKLYNIRNNIKIVCHSALMKKFLNKKVLAPAKQSLFGKRKLLNVNNNDKKLKYIEKKENMWSIILNSPTEFNLQESIETKSKVSEGEICITRHAFTNANIYKEQSKTYNPFIKVVSKYKQFTDKDTKLSLYGILGALDFEDEKINLNNCDNTVFVSILVRTWITALCLYLPKIHNDSKEFKLVISPFIKESGITLDNYPIPLSKQIIIIKNFLKFIRENFNQENQYENYYKNAKNINNFFDKNGKLVIYAVKKTKNGQIKYVKYEISYDSNKKCYISNNSNENYFTNKNNYIGLNKLYIKNLSILPGVRKPTSNMIKNHINPESEPLTENKVANFKNCMANIKIAIIDIDEGNISFTDDDINNFYNDNKYFFENSNILAVCSENSLSSGKEHFQHKLREKIEKENSINYNFKNSNKINSSGMFDREGNRVRLYTHGLDNDKLKIKFYKDGSNIYNSILCECQYDDYKFYILHIVFSVPFNENIIKQLINKYNIKDTPIYYSGLGNIYRELNSGINIIKNRHGYIRGKNTIKNNSNKNQQKFVRCNYFIKLINTVKNKKTNIINNSVITSNLGTNQRLVQNIQTNLERTSSLSNNNEEKYLV